MIGNYFTIRQGGQLEACHNTINNVFSFYKEYRTMCKFIYVKYGGEGGQGEKYMYLQPSLSAYNFNPENGRMYVTYEATVGGGDLVGETVSGAGFAAEENSGYLVNIAEFSIKKQAGEPLLISGTLFLANEGGSLCFLQGDNRLVRMLLGTEPFADGLFRITYGTENIAPEVYQYSAVYPSYFVRPTFGDNEISFNYNFTSAVTDLVLLLDNRPVLRASAPMSLALKEHHAYATEDYQFIIDHDGAFVKMEEFLISHNLVDGYALSDIPSGLNYLKDAGLRLPEGAEIKTDADSNHYAFVCGGKAAFLEVGGGEVKLKKWLYAKDILLAKDGAAFVVGEDDGITYMKGDTVLPLDFKSASDNTVVVKDGKYLFANHQNSLVSFYFFTPGQAVTKNTVASAPNAADKLLFVVEDTVVTYSAYSPAEAYSPLGKDTATLDWFNMIRDNAWMSPNIKLIYDSGRLLVYDSLNDFTRYFRRLDRDLLLNPMYGKIYGEFTVRITEGFTDIFKTGLLSGKLLTINGKVSFVAVKGIYLYAFFADGSVKVYAVNSDSLRVTLGKINKDLLITHRSWYVVPVSGSLSLKIKRN